MKIGVFKQARDRINAKPRYSAIQPEAHGVVHGFAHLRIAPVQIGLFGVKVMVVKLIRSGVECPGRMAKPRLPVVGRLAYPLAVAPDIPVALRIGTRRTRFLKPRMLVRCVIRHKIHDYANAVLLRFTDQAIEIRERAVERIDGGVIRNVIAEIHQGRRVHRADPDRVDGQVAKIIQLRGNSVDVANAVTIRILEAARIDLVNDSVLPPGILRLLMSMSRLRTLRRSLLCSARACREANAERTYEEEKFSAVQHGCSPCSFHVSIACLPAFPFHESPLFPPLSAPTLLLPCVPTRAQPARGDGAASHYWDPWKWLAADPARRGRYRLSSPKPSPSICTVPRTRHRAICTPAPAFPPAP